MPRGESASLATIPRWGQSQGWTSALQTHPALEKGVWHVLTQSHQDHDKEKAQKPNRFSTRKEPKFSNPFIFQCVPVVHWEEGWWTERKAADIPLGLHLWKPAQRPKLHKMAPGKLNYHHSGTLLAFIDCIAWYTWKFQLRAKILPPDNPRRL